MALQVNAIFGYPEAVEYNLLTLVHVDLSFGDEFVITDPTVVQITYSKLTSTFVRDRINTLVNTVFPNLIVVTAVDNTYMFFGPQGFMVSITKYIGITVPQRSSKACSGSTPVYKTDNILIIYDSSDCGGEGYWVRDDDHNKINEPGHAILFHELSHAFHWANRTSEFCLADKGEFQAVDDENGMRDEFSLPRRSRKDLSGGCGAPADANPWEALGCFVVSAVSGSPRSTQVSKFHKVRDSMLRPTSIGRSLFTELFAEYYQCAPRIVEDMDKNHELKNAVRRYVVEPLLDIFELTQLHFACDSRTAALDDRFNDIFEPWRATLSQELAQLGTVKQFKEMIVRLETSLRHRTSAVDIGPVAAFDVESPETIYGYLESTILRSTPTSSTLAWCLARPIFIYWKTMGLIGLGRDPAEVREELAADLETWVASAPVNWGDVSRPLNALRLDLQMLAGSVMRNAEVRQRFGVKLLRVMEAGSTRAGFAAVLQEADFLCPSTGGTNRERFES